MMFIFTMYFGILQIFASCSEDKSVIIWEEQGETIICIEEKNISIDFVELICCVVFGLSSPII